MKTKITVSFGHVERELMMIRIVQGLQTFLKEHASQFVLSYILSRAIHSSLRKFNGLQGS